MIQQFMADHITELYVFALMIWREAAGEPREGKVAVACTVLNRARHPKWWGRTPYEVILKAKQYSSMTFPGDPMTIRFPGLDDHSFRECLEIASKALTGTLGEDPVPGADSYYSITMQSPPKWADESKFVKQIAHHRFYNLDGDPGEGKAA